MNKRFKFTQKALAKLPLAKPGKRDIYHDKKYHFLKCRVSDTGNKCILISAKINGKSVKNVIVQFFGDERDLPIDVIRERARVEFDELTQSVGTTKRVPTHPLTS